MCEKKKGDFEWKTCLTYYYCVLLNRTGGRGERRAVEGGGGVEDNAMCASHQNNHHRHQGVHINRHIFLWEAFVRIATYLPRFRVLVFDFLLVQIIIWEFNEKQHRASSGMYYSVYYSILQQLKIRTERNEKGSPVNFCFTSKKR